MADQAEARWTEWIERACAELGVDPAAVDTRAVLALTATIAHEVDRPMAPVTAYILGLAVGQGGDAAELAARLDALARAVRGGATTFAL